MTVETIFDSLYRLNRPTGPNVLVGSQSLRRLDAIRSIITPYLPQPNIIAVPGGPEHNHPQVTAQEVAIRKALYVWSQLSPTQRDHTVVMAMDCFPRIPVPHRPNEYASLSKPSSKDVLANAQRVMQLLATAVQSGINHYLLEGAVAIQSTAGLVTSSNMVKITVDPQLVQEYADSQFAHYPLVVSQFEKKSPAEAVGAVAGGLDVIALLAMRAVLAINNLPLSPNYNQQQFFVLREVLLMALTGLSHQTFDDPKLFARWDKLHDITHQLMNDESFLPDPNQIVH